VRGMGLLIGVEFSQDIAESVMYACLERGLVINFLKANLLRVIPPLVITKTDVDEGLEILDMALTSLKY
jgi:4-aminobutyrate aminotransferase-like enzyme